MFQVERFIISDQVLSYLRKEIMLNHLKEGHHLKEIELSKQLNVSRGPIREAFTKLTNENLVEKQLNGRVVVKSYTKKDIEDLYDARILLENAALAEIDYEDFTQCVTDFTYYINLMKDSSKKTRADMAFHELIIKLSDNKTLNQLWSSLNGKVLTLIEITNEYLSGRHKEAVHEHLIIIESMTNRNLIGAQEALEIHLQKAAKYYMNAIEEVASGKVINNE